MTDPEGKRKKYVFDDLDRMSKVIEEDSAGNLTLETNYTHSIVNKLIQIVQGSQTRSFTYDSLGRLTAETHPESGTASYVYDDNGNQTSKTDSRGVISTSTYDALNRITGTSYSDLTPAATFSYDETSSSLIGSITNGKGRRTSAWTSDGIGYSWSFDTSGRVLQQVFKIDGVPYSTSYNYTGAGCGCPQKDLQSMTYPGNIQVNYTRDSIGRVLSISKPNPLANRDWYVRAVEYNSPHGAPSLIRFGHQIADTFLYDQTGRLAYTRIRDIAYPWVSWNFIYNSSGRINQITESRRETAESFPDSRFDYSYDRIGRLNSAVKSTSPDSVNWTTEWANSLTYDLYGNMLTNQLGFTTTFAVGFPVTPSVRVPRT